tara:strand:+ start:676 stop:813 length:138 start_codon:yes stop_codon:yes gene_type:complete
MVGDEVDAVIAGGDEVDAVIAGGDEIDNLRHLVHNLWVSEYFVRV